MLEKLLDFLNAKITEQNLFGKVYCLAELVTDASGNKAPKAYVTKGQWETVSDIDKSKGLCYWRQTGDVDVSINNTGSIPCNEELTFTYPLRLIASMPKKALNTDDAYSDHRIAESLIALFINNTSGLKITIGAKMVGINAAGYSVNGEQIFSQEYSGLTKKDLDYKFSYISIDVTMKVIINKSCLTTNCI